MSKKTNFGNVGKMISSRDKRPWTVGKFVWLFLGLLLVFSIFRLFTYTPFEFTDNPWYLAANSEQEGISPLNIAHRGGRNIGPENTIAAMEAALVAGADVLEMDVHLSADDELILMHDKTIDRTTDQSGEVRSFLGHTLKKILVQGKEPVPSLVNVFDHFAEREVVYLIEIKNNGDLAQTAVEKFGALVQEYNLQDKVIVASFGANPQDYMSELYPNISRTPAFFRTVHLLFLAATQLYKITGNAKLSEKVVALPVEFSGITLVNTYLIENLHNMGLGVYYWTVNDRNVMRDIVAVGADGIITDSPDLYQQLR